MTGLPSLGPRGEGWVAAQVVLFASVVISGIAGPSWSGPARLVTTACGIPTILAGGALAIRGATTLGRSFTPLPHPTDRGTLVDGGIYDRVRHPIYGGVIAMAAGWALVTASLSSLVLVPVTAGFFYLKTVREEAWLVDRYPTYRSYRIGKRRLLPGIW